MIAEIVSLPAYETEVSAIMDDDERLAMEYFVACAPERHPVIPGTGGFRKARWALGGKGKSGGARVVYFYIAKPGCIYMARAYAKSNRQNLSEQDKRALHAIASLIKRGPSGGELQ